MSDYVRQNGCENAYSDEEPWIILPAIELQIQKKINDIGTPLKEWDIHINRGVLTGFNHAFMIDGKKRDELIAQDPKSAEIIRPILRGRDVKRYGYNFADVWLLNIHNGVKDLKIPHVDINDYPAIKAHLDIFYPQLKKRQDKGVTPYNLRNCAYMEDFSKQKMVWKRIGSIIRFCYDESGTFTLDSTCIATGDGMKYLVAILNTRFGHYLLKDSPKTGTGDLLISVQAIGPVKIPKLREVDQKPFIELLDTIIECQSHNASYQYYEDELDKRVFELYHLSDEERNYVLKKY